MARAGVRLPDTMHIEFQKANSDRPKVAVFEQPENSRFKLEFFFAASTGGRAMKHYLSNYFTSIFIVVFSFGTVSIADDTKSQIL